MVRQYPPFQLEAHRDSHLRRALALARAQSVAACVPNSRHNVSVCEQQASLPHAQHCAVVASVSATSLLQQLAAGTVVRYWGSQRHSAAGGVVLACQSKLSVQLGCNQGHAVEHREHYAWRVQQVLDTATLLVEQQAKQSAARCCCSQAQATATESHLYGL